jgi:hypothetical protein
MPGFYRMLTSYPDNTTTYVAANPTTIEKLQGIYLTSDVLSSGSTYQTNDNNGHLEAKPSSFSLINNTTAQSRINLNIYIIILLTEKH